MFNDLEPDPSATHRADTVTWSLAEQGARRVTPTVYGYGPGCGVCAITHWRHFQTGGGLFTLTLARRRSGP